MKKTLYLKFILAYLRIFWFHGCCYLCKQYDHGASEA